MGEAAVSRQRDEPPATFRALSDVRRSPGGWAAACPLCGGHLEIAMWSGAWVFLCGGSCRHGEILAYLRAEALPAQRWATRMWLALRLAKTPDAWAGLILGYPVQPQAIDHDELTRLRKAGLWQ